MATERGKVAGAVSAGALLASLAAFGPQALQFVSDVAELRRDVANLREWKAEHLREHERLRDWLRRLSNRQQYYHGPTDPEPPPAPAVE